MDANGVRFVEVPAYVHESFDMGMKIDVNNIGEVLGILDEFDLADQQDRTAP